RLFLYDPEWADLARRSDVGSTTQFHRITVERARSTTDLQNAHGLAVFFPEELKDVGSFLRFRIRNFSPGNRRTLSDLVVHQFFYVADLLLRQWRARKVKRQFVRSDVTALLRSVTRDHFVQRPVQQVR